jgi:integrase
MTVLSRGRARDWGSRLTRIYFEIALLQGVAIDDPAHIGVASRLLGHRTRSTTERYYNQARGIEATRLMQKCLLARRNDLPTAIDPLDT